MARSLAPACAGRSRLARCPQGEGGPASAMTKVSRMRNRTVGLIALAALFALAGCASPPGAAAGDDELQDTARAQAADLARGLYRGPTDTIDDYARWADAKTSTGDVEVIGFEPYADAVHGEPFGLLR